MKVLKLTPDQEAAIAVNPKHRAAFRILAWFVSRGAKGGIVDECEAALDLRHQTASPRVNELTRAGCLTLTDDRRGTRSGKTARVYVYKPGTSFALFLGLPPRPRTSKAGLSDLEASILAAGKSYVAGRATAKSSEQVKKLMLKLVTTLNNAV